MKKFNVIILSVLLVLMSCQPATNRKGTGGSVSDEDKMAWWRDARFGLFIHWGLYAIPAGEWKGEKIPGISEWIMLNAKIPVHEYEALAKEFNPVKFNADEWVKLAKDAGMKYIVITSKHHDGFAMYHSKASPYNIVDATPFDRDPLEELSKACKQNGIKLGFYYSQAQDWNHPGGAYRGVEKGTPYWDATVERKTMEEYVHEKAIPQVKEILTNYGDIAVLWWDTPIGMTEPLAEELHELLKLQPEILENNRLYGPWNGDFSTPEQHIPPTGLDYDWEVCMTMNTSWGYKYYDDNWKSTETLIRYLTDIASKGGNFLLNVGPTSEGVIPTPSVDRLKAIGEWMKINGESIYGTTASPFFKLPWGRCTKKVDADRTILYFHVFNWPENSQLVIPGLKNEIRSAITLSSGEKLTYEQTETLATITLPAKAPDPVNSVIKIEISGEPEVISNMPAQEEDGSVFLPAIMADLYNRGYGQHAVLSEMNKDAYVTNWVDRNTRIEWMFRLDKPGEFKIEAELASENAKDSIIINCGKEKLLVRIDNTGNLKTFKKYILGEISIDLSGDKVLTISPLSDEWHPVNLKSIHLIPAE